MIKQSNEVFTAEAKTLHELFISEGGVAGFRIPSFQRNYDWDKDNIHRIFEDIASGLHWCTNEKNSITFIGTIIVVTEESSEKYFDGQSLSVIDGQQRLTTISIMASVLHEQIRIKFESVSGLPNNVKDWIHAESDYVRNELLDFAYGTVKVSGGKYFPFPRVVREYKDTRAKNSQNLEYRSAVASYLFDFAKFIGEGGIPPFEFVKTSGLSGLVEFNSNLKSIKEYVEELSKGGGEDLPILPHHADFEKAGIKYLFRKLPEDDSLRNKILSYCKKDHTELDSFVRLLAFSHYLMDSVIVTIVKTREEKYAFDIFDSLNTTGEPLTAIQTFKPQVIRFEKSAYQGSVSEDNFNLIESYINQFSGTDKKQRESKELITSFALYLSGEKLTFSLDEQRRYLRTNFAEIKGVNEIDSKRNFIKSLSDIAYYRNRFWDIENLLKELPTLADRDLIFVCLRFLKDLNSTLTIPLLCRFFVKSNEDGDYSTFASAVKAVTAFIALRRGVTGGTSGIDSDLRSIMANGRRIKGGTSTPLCLGSENKNDLISVEELRDYLREWLAKNRIEVTDKDTWVKKVINTGLANTSRPLCRFLILAAHHNARPDKDKSWKLVKTRPSPETDFLNHQKWVSDLYSTVEHIAPESPKKIESGWDKSIYIYPFLIHSLGNLTLLPQEENSAAANKKWDVKKRIYEAFSSTNLEDINMILKSAKKDGTNFSQKNIEMLKIGTHNPLTQTIANADNWDVNMINKRAINLAELAWDEISPWLFD